MSTGIGDTLRDAREQQGRTLEDAARTLRVRTDFLRALEDEHFDVFGGDIYAKGFLRNYASDLGLDPQPLLDTFRREIGDDDVRATQLMGGIAAPRTSRSAPPWIAWVLVAVVVMAVLAFIGGALDGRSPEVASDEPSGPPPAPAPTETVDETEPTPDAAPDDEVTDDEPEVVIEGVELLLALEESSWMQVTIDGTVTFEQTVPAGETLPFDGDREVIVRYGNAGGVRVQLNGEDLGAPGSRGQVVTVVYTPEGAEPT